MFPKFLGMVVPVEKPQVRFCLCFFFGRFKETEIRREYWMSPFSWHWSLFHVVTLLAYNHLSLQDVKCRTKQLHPRHWKLQ